MHVKVFLEKCLEQAMEVPDHYTKRLSIQHVRSMIEMAYAPSIEAITQEHYAELMEKVEKSMSKIV